MFERLKKRFLGENLEKPFLQKVNVSTTLTDDPNIESELGIQEIYGFVDTGGTYSPFSEDNDKQSFGGV